MVSWVGALDPRSVREGRRGRSHSPPARARAPRLSGNAPLPHRLQGGSVRHVKDDYGITVITGTDYGGLITVITGITGGYGDAISIGGLRGITGTPYQLGLRGLRGDYGDYRTGDYGDAISIVYYQRRLSALRDGSLRPQRPPWTGYPPFPGDAYGRALLPLRRPRIGAQAFGLDPQARRQACRMDGGGSLFRVRPRHMPRNASPTIFCPCSETRVPCYRE